MPPRLLRGAHGGVGRRFTTKPKIIRNGALALMTSGASSSPLELINVVTHFFAVLALGEMVRDLYETWSLLLVYSGCIVDSLMYHCMALLTGYFGGMDIGEWNLADHITAQAVLVVTPVFFLGISNFYILHGYVFVMLALLAVLLSVVIDVYYFTIGLTVAHLLLSFILMRQRWALAARDVECYLAFGFLAAGLTMYFLDPLIYPISHPIWHYCSFVSLWHFMRLRHKYFGFGCYTERSEHYRRLLVDARKNMTWYLAPSYMALLSEEEEEALVLNPHLLAKTFGIV
jgi:hypothetical protein